MSWGPNLLIKQGAKLVQEWNDVLVELKPEDRRGGCSRRRTRSLRIEEDSHSARVAPGSRPARPADLLAALRVDAGRQLDDLVESLEGYSSSEMIAASFELEMIGLVRQLPGKNFIKVWAEQTVA